MRVVAVLLPFLSALEAVAAQQWTDEQLVAACSGFQSEAPLTQLQQVAALLAQREQALPALIARVHGDHREYRLRIEQLLRELADPRWAVRETAERTLIEIGSRAWIEIEAKKNKADVLEQQIRCARILDALKLKGTEQEDRDRRLLRGLVTTALYLDADPRLLRALRSALGHASAGIADGAIRALGRHGDDEAADAIAQLLMAPSSPHRLAAAGALARMRSDRALAHCRRFLWSGDAGPPRTEAMAIVRVLQLRTEPAARALLQDLGSHHDPVLAAGARLVLPTIREPARARFLLASDRTWIDGVIGGWFGDSQLVRGDIGGLSEVELSFSDCETLELPANTSKPASSPRLFLNQGTLVAGEILAITASEVHLSSPLFGSLKLPRRDVQGIATDPALDRLIGASPDHDRVRLRNATFVDGRLLHANESKLVLGVDGGGERTVPMADVAGLLFARPRAVEADPTVYTRLDLVTGERLIGFVAGASSEHVAVSVPSLGGCVLPWSKVARADLRVGGGATWGFTLIADYSENCVLEVDDQGRVLWKIEDVFGVWDAECLDNGNVLITEFPVSRVQEVDRQGNQVWAFEDLKNPYDADRLPNGNTLIADTFGGRVIEVDRAGRIVWLYDKNIRPFDCDRLASGNTLIADVLRDRVLEVDPAGEIVWEATGLPNAHDADRLPNGNTLVTLRTRGSVVEIDRDGKVVWELNGLSSPSDADRLPNGNTIVAENTRVREFDRRGNEVWHWATTWAVEVNRY